MDGNDWTGRRRGRDTREVTIMLRKLTLAGAAGVALMVGGCGTDDPVGTPAPEGRATTETETPLELPEGQRLSATV